MTIFSWNVNGLSQILEKEDFVFLKSKRPEYIFFQNTHSSGGISPKEIKKWNYDVVDNMSKNIDAKNSGTMVLGKLKDLEYSFCSEVDEKKEGRIIEVIYNDVCLVNISSDIGKINTQLQKDKVRFHKLVIHHLQKRKLEGKKIILFGDFQMAMSEIDVKNPNTNSDYSGYNDEEVELMEILKKDGYLDVYRHFNPTEKDAYTFWPDRMEARRKNKGWRFDYFFISAELIDKVKYCDHITDKEGSTHCPIIMEIDL